MRRPFARAAAGLAAAATLAAGINIDCGHIRADNHKWDLSELDAKYSLAWYRPMGNAKDDGDKDKERVARTTFDLSVCRPMSRKDAGGECPLYSHICGVEDQMDGGGGNVAEAVRTFPIAVNDPVSSKYHLDPQWTRLSGEDEEDDDEDEDEDSGDKDKNSSRKQGLRLTVHGHPDAEHQYQMAVIDFLCIDKDKKSKDGKEVEEEKAVPRRQMSESLKFLRRAGDDEDDGGDKDDRDDGDGGDNDGDGDDEADRRKKQKDFDRAHKDWAAERVVSDGKGGEIRFVSYKYEKIGRKKNEEGMVLRLDWDTVHACEGAADDPELHQSSGWGFFSWLFFLSFVGIAGYFAFFAWINYTRYGRSGFDMLPHADTLRDLPQLLAEYAGKAVNTLRGGRASGGYSAL